MGNSSLDRIVHDDGTLIWETNPFPAGVARDRQGGLVFTDSTGLWWFRSGTDKPESVGEGDAYEVFAVATTPSGPIALVWGAGPSYYDLSDGSRVESPPNPPVEISSEPPWLTWTATNGFSAWVTEPEVVRDAVGQPSEILEPAHLVVANGEEILLDTRIADPAEAWATIHDFDGQRLIISRGPSNRQCRRNRFYSWISQPERSQRSSGLEVPSNLTGPDSDWHGPVATTSASGFTLPGGLLPDQMVLPVMLVVDGVVYDLSQVPAPEFIDIGQSSLPYAGPPVLTRHGLLVAAGEAYDAALTLHPAGGGDPVELARGVGSFAVSPDG